jgi:hypothetical protein
MDVFLSWAGDSSKALATLMYEFLPVVVQECVPWMSAYDILAGQPWDPQLEAALKRAAFGVLCITPQNQASTYLHYEAGAIANQVGGQNRVCPLLIGGLTPPQLAQPLGRFQGKLADEQGIWELVQSLNTIAERPIEGPRLRKAFEGQWVQLQTEIAAIKLDTTAPIRRSPEDLLDETLQHIRILTARLNPQPKKLPERLRRQYEQDLMGVIHANLSGSFEWSIEDTKGKAVVADGIATTLTEAQRQADAAANARPVGAWQAMRA